MKFLTFLAAFCTLTGFGWLVLNPGHQASDRTGVDKIKEQLTTIYDDVNQRMDGSRVTNQGTGSAVMSSVPDQAVAYEMESTPSTVELVERTTEALPRATSEGHQRIGKKPDFIHEAVKDNEPVGMSMNHSSSIESPTATNSGKTEKMDPNATIPFDRKATELEASRKPAAIEGLTTATPSEVEVERYLERIQAAGTRANKSLERVARMLGR